MSLIKVNGLNPFSGQSDPYLSMDSQITYENNSNGQIQNTYTLQGNLTGCDKNTLAQLRDSFNKILLIGKKTLLYQAILK